MQVARRGCKCSSQSPLGGMFPPYTGGTIIWVARGFGTRFHFDETETDRNRRIVSFDRFWSRTIPMRVEKVGAGCKFPPIPSICAACVSKLFRKMGWGSENEKRVPESRRTGFGKGTWARSNKAKGQPFLACTPKTSCAQGIHFLFKFNSLYITVC